MSYYHNGNKSRTYISKQAYLDYLQSPEWKAKAAKRREIDNNTCQLCGRQQAELEVHHISYFNLKSENPYVDLISLCPKCHESVHLSLIHI